MLMTVMKRSALIAFISLLSFNAYAVADDFKAVTVPPGDLASALESLGKQFGVDVIYPSEQIRGLKTPGLSGTLDVQAAFTKLLEGTPLTFRKDTSGALLIALPKNGDGAAPGAGEATTALLGKGEGGLQPSDNSSAQKGDGSGSVRLAQGAESQSSDKNIESAGQELPAPEESGKAIPEVLVIGSRSLNMDIRRSRDDAQPYVIFTRERIEQSGATSVEDFLKQRLPMNTVAGTNSQGAALAGSSSQVNLRGLGTDQTLILVDGHRAARPVMLAGPQQSDMSGIPLAAVERIEVLPTTASGIYGGSATGGVINVVLRRDYVGVESKLTQENTFDAAAATRRAEVSAGFSLEGGKTNVLLAGSYADSEELLVGERPFVQRGRATIRANNPGFFLSTVTPPLGATTNIRSANGSPLFGPGTANFTSVPIGYAGGGGRAPLAVNAGRYNFDLANAAQSPGGALGGLLNGPTAKFLSATVRREFSGNLQAFLEASASDRISHFGTSGLFGGNFTILATAPNNPFGQAINVSVPTAARDSILESSTDDRRLVAGVIYRLPAQWRAEADYTWDRSRSSFVTPTSTTEGSEIATGAVDVLRDTNLFPLQFSAGPVSNSVTPFRTTLKNATLRVAGPVGSLPGGALTLSGMLERNDEFFSDATFSSAGVPTRFFPERSQVINSAYLELNTPLVSTRNAMSGIQELDLQIAGRYDDYSIDTATNSVPIASVASIIRPNRSFTSTNPTFGLKYRPFKDLMLRASYGGGFRPPSTQELTPAPVGTNSGGLASDPRRGNEPTGPVQLITGGNSSLLPEESTSRSIGIVLTPSFVPALRLSVDYSRIEKTDNITVLPTQQLIDNESLLPGRVTRGPVPPNDPFGVGRITVLDLSSVNLSRTLLEAFDFAVDYQIATGSIGTFELFAGATKNTHYQTQVIASAPVVENVGVTRSFPLKFKGNAGLTWNYQQLTLGWTAQHFGSYTLTNPTQILNQGSARIPSQTYHDVFGRYQFDRVGRRLLDALEAQVGVKNVFDIEPPFDATNTTYFYSTYGDPRMATYYLSLKAAF